MEKNQTKGCLQQGEKN